MALFILGGMKNVLRFFMINMILIQGCTPSSPPPSPGMSDCEHNIPACTLQPGLISHFEISSLSSGDKVSIQSSRPTFLAEGQSEGLYEVDSCYKVVLLIYPDVPQGAGWYPQCDLGQVDPSGNWFVTGNLGNTSNKRPNSGDAFSIKAYITTKPNEILKHKVLPQGFIATLEDQVISSNVVLLLRVE